MINNEHLFAIFLILFIFIYLEDIRILIILFIIIYIYNEFFIKQKNTNNNNLNFTLQKPNIIQYNDNLESHFKELKKYKSSNKISYYQGLYYWKLFIKTLHTLENPNLYNFNQYFEKAESYFKKSINILQSMSTSVPERNRLNGLKYNDFTNMKHTNKISNIVKKIYIEGDQLLYNLSIKLNQKWKENPHIHNKEIIYIAPNSYNQENINDKLSFYL